MLQTILGLTLLMVSSIFTDTKHLADKSDTKADFFHTNVPSYKTIILHPNETKEIYFYINLSGRVFYKITNKSGTNKINCWWIKGPFGTVEGIGTLSNQGNTPFKGLLWGKLKATGADSETTILITESAEVAINFPSIHY